MDLRRVSGSEATFGCLGEDQWRVTVGPPRWRFYPFAATLGVMYGTVARPFLQIVRRSRLRLEGSHPIKSGILRVRS